MNKKVLELVFAITFLIFSTTSTLNTMFYSDNAILANNYPLHINMRFINSQISINDNVQLATQASSGDGSSTNPFIIENYAISKCTSNTYGFSIQNTNKYFILQNISVSNCGFAFYFKNVTFGSIINSVTTANIGSGFFLDSSSNNTLINNTASNNSNGGFFLQDSSSNNTLINNTASNNGYGFYVYSSSNNILINNTAPNNYYGFELYLSSDNTLINNTAISNTYGFGLYYSSNNTLKNNIAHYNKKNNYDTYHSVNSVLINDNFSNPDTMTFFGFFEVLGLLCFLILSIITLVGVFIHWRPRKRRVIEHQEFNKAVELNDNQKPNRDPTIAVALVEDILKETYQVPDYATAVKIQEGGFPDYATFKQALDKGITTYAEWLKYQKEK